MGRFCNPPWTQLLGRTGRKALLSPFSHNWGQAKLSRDSGKWGFPCLTVHTRQTAVLQNSVSEDIQAIPGRFFRLLVHQMEAGSISCPVSFLQHSLCIFLYHSGVVEREVSDVPFKQWARNWRTGRGSETPRQMSNVAFYVYRGQDHPNHNQRGLPLWGDGHCDRDGHVLACCAMYNDPWALRDMGSPP